VIVSTADNLCLMRNGWQNHAACKPDCGLGETPKIVKRWNSKSMMAIFIKKRAALTVSKLLISIVKSKEEVHLPVCDVATPMAYESRRFL